MGHTQGQTTGRSQGENIMLHGIKIITCDGHKLPWFNEIWYLGTYIVQSRQFKCSLESIMPKNRSFVRLTLSLVKLVGMHPKKIILELFSSKFIPILIYGLECFALTKSDLKSLDFAVSRFLMK